MKKLFTLFFVTFFVTIASAQEPDAIVLKSQFKNDVTQTQINDLQNNVKVSLYEANSLLEAYQEYQVIMQELIDKNKKGKDMKDTFFVLSQYISQLQGDLQKIELNIDAYTNLVMQPASTTDDVYVKSGTTDPELQAILNKGKERDYMLQQQYK